MSEAKKTLNSYGPEFKAKVGLEALRGVKTINEIAQEYGVHPVLVGQWKKEIPEQAGTLFEGKRGPKPQETHESEDRLYGEIGRLKMELDWLKKSPGCVTLPRFHVQQKSVNFYVHGGRDERRHRSKEAIHRSFKRGKPAALRFIQSA
jgi:transposase-like protein